MHTSPAVVAEVHSSEHLLMPVPEQQHEAVVHCESVGHACPTVPYAVHVLKQEPEEQLHCTKQSVLFLQYWLYVFVLEQSDEHVCERESQEHGPVVVVVETLVLELELVLEQVVVTVEVEVDVEVDVAVRF